jgi:hypothetical protein
MAAVSSSSRDIDWATQAEQQKCLEKFTVTANNVSDDLQRND